MDTGRIMGMEVLSSRILLRPTDPVRSRRFYRDILGLAIYREFGPEDDPGLVFFLEQGLLEISGRSETAPDPGSPSGSRSWTPGPSRNGPRGGSDHRPPARAEPWGLVEMWIEDPDGVRIVLVEV